MKSQVWILSLVLVLVYGQDKEPQASTRKTLGPEELHQVGGDWVLQWLVYNRVKSQSRQFPLMSSSYVQLQPQEHGLTVLERNSVAGKCVSFSFNLTLAPRNGPFTHLDMHRTEVEVDGEPRPIDSRATIWILPGSQNLLKLHFKGHQQEDMLALYRRDGKEQQEVEEMQETADWLGLSGDSFQNWTYDGHSDFCHKSVLPSLGPEQLQQVQGEWVVVALVYDRVKSQGRQIPFMSSSHVQVQVQERHLLVHEHNTVGGHCASYPFNVTLPPSGSDTHRLKLHRTKWFLNGEVHYMDENATLEFFPVSRNTMRLLYRGQDLVREDFLIMYRRAGHQGEDLQEDLEEHRAMARSLGLSGGNFGEWLYGGATDFCHKKSTVEN